MDIKRALVTGGGQRLGRVLSLELAKNGFDVAVHYSRSADGAQETVDQIGAMGSRAVALQADLSREEEVAGLIDRAADGLGGPISVLVNNASVFRPDSFSAATLDTWQDHMSVNLRAPFVLTQAMAAQAPAATKDAQGEPLPGAMVVYIGDHWGARLAPDFAVYALSKGALASLTEIAATSLAGQVRVNAIGPGPTIVGHRQRPEHFAAQRQAIVSGRGSNPEDIARALIYLVETPAVTGAFLQVDGGLHLGWVPPK